MKHNGFEYIDLGLPSGTKWATCNVGANSETDNGLYFPCGGIVGLDSPHYEGNFDSHILKYNGDIKATLHLDNDAAHIHMGGKWHMPTKEQFRELKSNTIMCWETNYNGSGINGMLFISMSDTSKKLFFPASGRISCCVSECVGRTCNYWSSSIYNNNGCYGFDLSMAQELAIVGLKCRYGGNTIRGVFNTFWMK